MDDEYEGVEDATLADLLEAQATWVKDANFGRTAAVMAEAAKRLRGSSVHE